MERNLSKKRILELYLNVIEWGDGIYGAEAASQYYFHNAAVNPQSARGGFFVGDDSESADSLQSAIESKNEWRAGQRIIMRLMPGVKMPA